eukprot:TRINITY_DN14603_c0_g1_i1.p1 TRINITY_DN14603_c0_g1~~TRINITY_DN14603_c0_g1_i1.p1  ORF type:complete len:142 (+),score=30.96 TRINITY_DN14603_c0_g1_i1:39-464(+)
MHRLRTLSKQLVRSRVGSQQRFCSGVGEGNPTVFGGILRGDIPCDKVYEDDEILAFNDVAPAAPVHVLVIPKRRIEGISAAEETDGATLGKLLLAAKKVAEKMQLENGYRLVINDGRNGGQTVGHIHVHVLGGRQMTWPPG